MVHSVVYDDHEGFAMGSPEFEVHTWARNRYQSGRFEDVQCAGAQKAYPHNYDQNAEAWWGSVLLIAQSQMAGDSVMRMLWEDDDGAPCSDAPGGSPPTTTTSVRNLIQNTSARHILKDPNGELAFIQSFVRAVYVTITGNHDDFVGFIGADGPSAGCWESAGPTNFSTKDLNGNKVGYAAIDFTYGTRTPLCPHPEPLPYNSVTIGGPLEVRPDVYCYYSGSVTAGTPPYSYQWFSGTTWVGDGPEVDVYTGWGPYPFYLFLDVTDAEGRPGYAARLVNVTDSAKICPM
jgi:hypothetical protein